jgi:hypothetical protein
MVNHPDRSFSFAKIKNKDDLVEAMFNHKWPLCYSFYHDDLLYLNDGESEDYPEYAVVTIDKTEGRFEIHGREVGRIITKNMQAKDAIKFIQGLEGCEYTGEDSVQVVVEPKWHHSCQLCGLEEDY